jgi:hypothetical protein
MWVYEDSGKTSSEKNVLNQDLTAIKQPQRCSIHSSLNEGSDEIDLGVYVRLRS